ncbi:MAG: vitamin K epoxide reductase family protein [Polyangiaceae bacterium]
MQSEHALEHEEQKQSIALRLLLTLLVWLPTVLGLAMSAALLVDYVRPAPIFCEENGGCDVVKRTVFAALYGIPTPVFGLVGFVALAVLALLRGKRFRIAHLVVASGAALVAMALLFVQFLMGVYCKYCMVVDISALALLAGTIVRAKTAWDPPPGRTFPALLTSLFALAVGLPLAFGFLQPIKVPPAIAEELKKTPPGVVTIIDFVDFECPFCRMTHQELTPEGCEKIAASLGLDPAAFRDCVKDPKIDERIQSDVAEFKASRGHGLPTIWINTQKLEGAQPGPVLESAIKSALKG